MLELDSCHCVQPQFGRPYLAKFPASTAETKPSGEQPEDQVDRADSVDTP